MTLHRQDFPDQDLGARLARTFEALDAMPLPPAYAGVEAWREEPRFCSAPHRLKRSCAHYTRPSATCWLRWITCATGVNCVRPTTWSRTP